MQEYWRQRWPNAAGPANTPVGEKIRKLSRAMAAGWRSVRDYLELLGISWKIDIVSRLTESGRIAEGLRGESKKALYQDHHGAAWLIKVKVASPDEFNHLLSAADYQTYVGAET